MTPTHPLRVTALYKQFARRPVLDGIELELPAAGCTLLTGENGAGKSTLMRILAGLERADGGCFHLAGEAPLPWRKARRRLLRRILYLHQQPYLFDGSVEHNLQYVLKRSPLDPDERRVRLEEALQWIDMADARHQPARRLSGGERQRVALARAWLANPAVMLLDEPTANLDQEARRWTLTLLQRLLDQGMTLLITSHDPDHFAPLCQQRLHLDGGRLVQVTGSSHHWPGKVVPIRRDFA
jgi:tungstate transport system ATP-binding protein